MSSLVRLISRFWLACLMLSTVFGVVAPAQAEPADSGHALVELVADHSEVAPGQTIRAALVLELDPHWHVYWKNPGDSGLPSEILWQETSETAIGDFQWPAPHPQPLEGLMNYGYEDELILPFEVTIPETASGDVTLAGTASFLICEDICIPEDAPVYLNLAVGASPVANAAKSAVFMRADDRRPMGFEGEAVIDRSGEEGWQLSLKSGVLRAAVDADIASVRFFPADHQILHPPEQPVSMGEHGITLTLQKGAMPGTDGIDGVVVVEDVEANRVAFEVSAEAGSVIDGTYSETLVMGGDPAPAFGFTQLLGFLGAALLGGLILNLMPCVLPVLFIKAQSILSLSGRDDSSEIRAHGFFYTAGVVLCFLAFGAILVALRAAGEAAGLGFQLKYPPVVLLLSLLMLVLGLNMLGWFDFGSSVMGVGSSLAGRAGHQGAFFTGLLAAFVGAPCIGPYLSTAIGAVIDKPPFVVLLVFLFLGLGMASPFLLVSLIPGSAKLLPKPGPWMEKLKQFFAFPLFLTAVWLVWVLATQVGSFAVLYFGAAATAIIFAIWLLKGRPAGGLGRLVANVVAVMAISGAVIAPAFALRGGSSATIAQSASSFGHGYDGDWSPQKVASLQAEGKAVFVDFTASWCVTCLVNKRTSLQNARVKQAFAEEGVTLLIADWTSRDKVIAEELAKYGRAGVPLYLYFPATGGPPVILPQILSPSIVIDTISEA